MSREKTRPTKRVSRNQTKVFRAAPTRKYPPQYETYTTRLPVPLNPSRRFAREANATLPRSRLRCARWTSIIYHRSQPRSAKHRRPRNGQIDNARAEANGRATRALGMRSSSPSQRENGAWHQNHLQTKNRKGRANRKVEVQIRGSGIPTNKRYPLR